MADAGKYELLDLFWDEVTSAPDAARPTFKRHKQGDVVTLDAEEATRLVEAGSVAPEGERERQALAQAEAAYRAALALVPDHLRHLAADADPAELAKREVPTEELTVHTAPGFINEGHPQYASGTQGQGSGDGPEDTEAGDVEALQASLDDGAKTTRAARGGVRQGQGQPTAKPEK